MISLTLLVDTFHMKPSIQYKAVHFFYKSILLKYRSNVNIGLPFFFTFRFFKKYFEINYKIYTSCLPGNFKI